MALRGDSIDNIPGAPGIGDKGSVELIQQFGTVEAAIDRADEVKKKTYRESLEQPRQHPALERTRHHPHQRAHRVHLEAMRTQPVDNAACRALFTELEFTTLLKDLAPDIVYRRRDTTYNLKPPAEEITTLLAEARAAGHLAIALRQLPTTLLLAEEVADREPAEAEVEPEPPPAENMSLFGAPLRKSGAKTGFIFKHTRPL
jgi:DNA polymerase-1